MKNLNKFLKNNPELLSKYVSVGLTIVDKAVAPLNGLMKHLMEVQGIDPNTQPGAIARRVLERAVGAVPDNKDFDPDFNFSRFYSKFEKAQAGLDHLNLTKEEYRKATDLSKVDDRKPEIRLFPTEDEKKAYFYGSSAQKSNLNPLEELEAFVRPVETTTKLDGPLKGINIQELKSALKEIKRVAEDSSRPVEIKNGARLFPATKGKVNKFEGGLFRRVNK